MHAQLHIRPLDSCCADPVPTAREYHGSDEYLAAVLLRMSCRYADAAKETFLTGHQDRHPAAMAISELPNQIRKMLSALQQDSCNSSLTPGALPSVAEVCACALRAGPHCRCHHRQPLTLRHHSLILT